MSQVIQPTQGRQLWFYPGGEDRSSFVRLDAQPLAATVVFVSNERTVNLQILDHNGYSHAKRDVVLVQPGDEVPNCSHATWMPYQIKVAVEAVAEPEGQKTRLEPAPDPDPATATKAKAKAKANP